MHKIKKRNEKIEKNKTKVNKGWLGFYDISRFVGYLTPNPFLY